MSLRRRLAVVLVLGLSALLIAAVAIIHVLVSSNDSRDRAAEADADAAAQALAERVEPGSLSGPPDPRLHNTANSVLRPMANAAGGYCARNGAILAVAGRMGREHKGDGPAWRDGPRGVPPEVSDAVSALCAKARPGSPAKGRIDLRRGVGHVAAVAVGDRGAAWCLVRLRSQGNDEGPAWPLEVILLAVVIAALCAVTLDAMRALRRGAGELKGSLVKLQDDLRAPVPKPRATELRDIAAELSRMAAHLADARDRERNLGQQLAREQRLAALGRVVAGVAHEVRNPLAGMKLRLDLLARAGGLDTAAREDVGACLGEIARLNRLVESLLTVSRAKSVTRQDVALGALSDDRLSRAQAAAQKAGVELAREGDAVASADPDTLAGAMDNLLRNAIEASPRGGTVTVRVGQAQGAAVLDVEDQGPGIPEARRAELFEPFFTTKPEGTGLGLWISRLLLEAKGAALGYERVGDRTRMRITFPPRREATTSTT
jgi:signal transduction histidine kinase